MYYFLKLNLPYSLPSVTNLKVVYAEVNVIPKEGEVRMSQLREFLTARNLPMYVYCYEDTTRSVVKIQYCSITNQLVGFVPPLNNNGLPTLGSFPARSSAEVKRHFDSECVSNYIYVIMAASQR